MIRADPSRIRGLAAALAATLALAFAAIADGAEHGAVSPAQVPAIDALTPGRIDVLAADLASFRPLGIDYEDTIPDTLDLAERAAWSVRGLTVGSSAAAAGKPAAVYQYRFSGDRLLPLPEDDERNTPILLSNKHARILPLLRAVSGSVEGIEIEAEYVRVHARQALAVRPSKGGGPPTENPHVHAHTAMALYNRFVRDGRPEWLTLARHIADMIRKSVVRTGDLAWVPPSARFDAATGKFASTRPSIVPYDPNTEPWIEPLGYEGTVKYKPGILMRALVRDYHESRDEESLRTAEALRNFLLKPGLWDLDPRRHAVTRDLDEARVTGFRNYSPDYELVTRWTGYVPAFETFSHEGREIHPIFSGTTRGSLVAFEGLFAFAIATGDDILKRFVAKGYEHAVRIGLPAIGWTPYWSPPGSWDAPAHRSEHAMTGIIGNMVTVGVMLSVSGAADCWDEVDRTVRNALGAAQFPNNLDRLRAVTRIDDDAELSKLTGLFSVKQQPTFGLTATAADNDANGAIGIYDAWEATMVCEEGIARANLPLNRAARWGDLYSSVPYEGKVVYRNKEANAFAFRVPEYVANARESTIVAVDGSRVAAPAWEGRYVLVTGLEKGAEVVIAFPLATVEERFSWQGYDYVAKMRGNTVIDINADAFEAEAWGKEGNLEGKYPLYFDRRESGYEAGETPTRTVRRFVSDVSFPRHHEPFHGGRR